MKAVASVQRGNETVEFNIGTFYQRGSRTCFRISDSLDSTRQQLRQRSSAIAHLGTRAASRTSANKRGTSAPPSKSGYARIAPRRCACASACTRLSPAPASGRPSRRPLDRKHIQRHASQSPHPPSCDAHNLAPLPPRAPVAPDARATLAASRRKCPASPAHRRGPRWQPWRGRCRVSRRTDT